MSFVTHDNVEFALKALTAIGTLAGAVAVWVAFHTIQKRDRNNKWTDGFRTLYAEFWKDDEIRQVRSWTINDVLYKRVLRPVLTARLATEEVRNALSSEQNEVLSKLDSYCSILVRLRSFGEQHELYMDARQRELFAKLLDPDQIISSLYQRGRPELIRYISIFWKELRIPEKFLKLPKELP